MHNEQSPHTMFDGIVIFVFVLYALFIMRGGSFDALTIIFNIIAFAAFLLFFGAGLAKRRHLFLRHVHRPKGFFLLAFVAALYLGMLVFYTVGALLGAIFPPPLTMVIALIIIAATWIFFYRALRPGSAIQKPPYLSEPFAEKMIAVSAGVILLLIVPANISGGVDFANGGNIFVSAVIAGMFLPITLLMYLSVRFLVLIEDYKLFRTWALSLFIAYLYGFISIFFY